MEAPAVRGAAALKGPPSVEAARVVVVHDLGAADIMQLRHAAQDTIDLIIAVPRSSHVDPRLNQIAARVGELVAQAPDESDRCFVDRLRAMKPDGIVTFSDRQVRRTAEMRAALGLLGLPPSLLDVVTDKLHQRRILSRSGRRSTAGSGTRVSDSSA